MLATVLSLLLVLHGAVWSQSAPQNATQGIAPSVLPADTVVRLRTMQAISSKRTKIGDGVPLEVFRDVRIGDLLVISRQTPATANVSFVQPARRLSRGGSLALELKSVNSITGDVLPIRAEKATQGGPGGAVSDIKGSSTFLFVPVILGKGDEATVARGTVIDAYLEHDIALDTERLRARTMDIETRNAALRKPYATIHIYRHSPDVGGGKPGIYLDGSELAHIQGDRYLNVMVQAGKHSFRTDRSAIELDCKAGEEYYLRMERRGLGIFSPPRAYLMAVSNEEGDEQVYPLKELNLGDVKDRAKLLPSHPLE